MNPLLWPEGDERTSKLAGTGPTTENLLAFLQGPFLCVGLEELRRRYERLTETDRIVSHVPLHQDIAPNILLPIIHAKGAYILGHYISCIALCGFVAECLAIYRYDVTPPAVKAAVGISAKKFEEDMQARRVRRLLERGLVDADTAALFDLVREARPDYLHYMSTDKTGAEAIARRVYEATIHLLLRILGIGGSGISFTLQSDVLDAMRKLPPVA